MPEVIRKTKTMPAVLFLNKVQINIIKENTASDTNKRKLMEQRITYKDSISNESIKLLPKMKLSP